MANGRRGKSEDTFATNIHIDDVPNPYVDHSQKSLVLLFKFLLVKDLYGEYAVLRCSPIPMSDSFWRPC